MRDTYPEGSSIPREFLVPEADQPDFSDLDGVVIGDYDDLGSRISDANVLAGLGDDVAVIHAESGRQFTFAELSSASSQLARRLKASGIVHGDRIAFRSPNVPEVVVLALAVWKAGAVIVPTPLQARAKELRFFLDDTGARFLFVFDDEESLFEARKAVEGTQVDTVIAFDDSLATRPETACAELSQAHEELLPVPADSVAIIWHTGGTTGRPKAIYHTHRRMLLGAFGLARATGAKPGERWLAGAPVGHALGFASVSSFTMLHGVTVVIVEDFSSAARLLDAIAKYRVSTFTAIAITWVRMLDELQCRPEIDLSSLEQGFAMWQSASSGQLFESWRQRGIELRNNFGCTSFSSWILSPRRGEPVPQASLGKPVPGYEVIALALPGTEIEAVETGSQGRMAVRGVSGLTYWNRPELQARDVVDGWVVVDDVIRFDPDGNAAYLGRTDFVISSAGNKITPVEVEEALAMHAAVREVGVVGAPDAERQEIVAAFVSLENGFQPSDALASELQKFAKTQIAPYKYPRRITFVEELPRDAVGKLQHGTLKQWAAENGLSESRDV